MREILLLMVLITGCTSKPDETNNIQSVGENNSQLPYLFQDLEGQVYLSWVETIDTDYEEQSVFKYAKLLEDQSWSSSKIISEGNDWFVNWADYPMIATFKGNKMIAHYLAKSGEGTYSYDVAIKTSQDQGKNWSNPKLINNDGKEAEHGFVSMVPYGDNFFITWLDGRNTSMEEGHYGAMTVRGAIVTPEGKKINEWELDNRVCDCCQTGAAITDNGPIVVYRDRSENEIRDIYITRLVDSVWTKPVAIHNDNWEIMGCPVNGPRVSTQGNKVAIAWFTASPDARVNVVFSNDGGKTFSEPIRVDEKDALGRVDVEWIDGKNIYVSWMERATIIGAKVSVDRDIDKEVLAESSSARSSGFPQIEIFDDIIILAWTDSEKEKVLTKFINL